MTVEPMTDAKWREFDQYVRSCRRSKASVVIVTTSEAEAIVARLDAERSRAEAAEAERDAALALAMPEWRPIETAPHDVLVLLYCPERGPANPERIELGYASHGSRNAVSSSISRHSWATMWQPLPALPIPPTED